MNITIGHLYPDLLNLYGDRGNIQCLKKRCEWRGIRAEVKEFRSGDKVDFQDLDIVLLGGGSDREQMIVCNKLKEYPARISRHMWSRTASSSLSAADYQASWKILPDRRRAHRGPGAGGSLYRAEGRPSDLKYRS